MQRCTNINVKCKHFDMIFLGWEENKNVVAKKIRQEAKMRRKRGKKAAQ